MNGPLLSNAISWLNVSCSTQVENDNVDLNDFVCPTVYDCMVTT